MQLQRSVIELEISLIQFKSSLIRPTRLQYGIMLESESFPIQLQSSLIKVEIELSNSIIDK